MRFNVVPMLQKHAEQIVQWSYGGDYAFYDWPPYPEDVAELLDADIRRSEGFQSVLDEGGELVGYFNYLFGDGVVEIGLGLRPDLTGSGHGESFLEAGLDYAIGKFDPSCIMLNVAAFNQRAIKVYERAGFQTVRTYERQSNRGTHEFAEMRLEIAQA